MQSRVLLAAIHTYVYKPSLSCSVHNCSIRKGQEMRLYAVTLASGNPGESFPQICKLTGNNRLDSPSLETKASTSFTPCSVISGRSHTRSLGACVALRS